MGWACAGTAKANVSSPWSQPTPTPAPSPLGTGNSAGAKPFKPKHTPTDTLTVLYEGARRVVAGLPQLLARAALDADLDLALSRQR